MRVANTAFIAGGLGFAVSVLVGCGSSGGLLTAEQANRLEAQLHQASLALDQGECAAAGSALSGFRGTVYGLGSVDSQLVSDLSQGAYTIAQLTERECPTVTTERSTTIPATTTKTSTSTTSTSTTQTTTSPTTTTTTPTNTSSTPTTTSPTTTTTTPTQTTTSPTTTTTTPTNTSTTTTPTTTTPSGGAGVGGSPTTTTTTEPGTGGGGING